MTYLKFLPLLLTLSLGNFLQPAYSQSLINLDAEPWTGPKVMQKTHLDEKDLPKEIVKKASSVTASKRQMRHHQDEFTAFVHFGPNTFSGVEWGSGKENVQVFHPKGKVDTDQWCRIFKEAGMKKVVMTVKHHDGFCLWQTKYNDKFGVRATKWKDGKGDILKDLSDSCKKHGLKLGIYLSPADLYQIESKEGLYGNGSKAVKSVIPTSPSSFQTAPSKKSSNYNPQHPAFEVIADDYNRYFMNQLYELLTEYGPIEEVWFDGAHPKRKGGQKYKKLQWFRMIRHLAPNAVIFGGPDVRWCGNESGRTRKSEWSVLTFQDESTCGEDRPADDIASDKMIVAPNYKVYGKPYKARFLSYNIAETDVSIRNGWFWRDARTQSVRSADNVYDMYERAVGGNSVLLLNVPPNRNGKIDTADAECLKEVGRRIRETYGQTRIDENNILLNSSDVETPNDQKNWQPFSYRSNEGTNQSIAARGSKPVQINRIVLQEDVEKTGQRVSKFELAVRQNPNTPFKVIHIGTTIGYKRIVRIPDMKLMEIRFRVLESRNIPKLVKISGHFYQKPIPSVRAIPSVKDGRRTGNWKLLIEKPNFSFHSHSRAKQKKTHIDSPHPVYFTLDGSVPNLSSQKYDTVLSLPKGSQLKARIFKDRKWGPTLVRDLPISTNTLKITQQEAKTVKSAHSPSLAIDGDTSTYWMATADGKELPQLRMELKESIKIQSIQIAPIQTSMNGKTPGFSMVSKGRVEISSDGKTWKQAQSFEFGNLKNDPSPRTISFTKPVQTKWLRICPEKTLDGGLAVSFSEVEIFPSR